MRMAVSLSVLDDVVKGRLDNLGYSATYLQMFALLPGAGAVMHSEAVSLFWEKSPLEYIVSFCQVRSHSLNELLSHTAQTIAARGGSRLVFLWPESVPSLSSWPNIDCYGEYVYAEHHLRAVRNEVAPGVIIEFEPFRRSSVESLVAEQVDSNPLTALSIVELDAIGQVYRNSFVTARVSGEVVGFMCSHEGTRGVMWFRKLYVSRHHRRNHIAASMMGLSLTMAADGGARIASGLTERRMWDEGFGPSLGFVQKGVLYLHQMCVG